MKRYDILPGLKWQGAIILHGETKDGVAVEFDAQDPSSEHERYVFDRAVLTPQQFKAWTGVDLHPGEVTHASRMELVEQQPRPERNQRPPVWDLVVEDMRARDSFGEKKYGTRLQPHNGRDPLVDLYQELLDAVVYCRQAIFERDGK